MYVSELSQLIKFSLSHNRAKEALRQVLPDQLKDTTFSNLLRDDSNTKKWLSQLLINLMSPSDAHTPFGTQQ